MPTIDVSKKDLENLIGKKLPEDKEELFSKIKAEVEGEQGDTLTLELGDTNRVDLWSVEGIARELKGHMDVQYEIKKYRARKSNYAIKVGDVKVRPFIAACVVKGIKLDEHVIKQLMQQQEKIDTTYGRMRKKTSIGLYAFDELKFPLKYDLADPKTKFVPLGFDEEMTLKQVLEKHPKGKEYGHILENQALLPLFTDANDKVLSMPPIINSEELGKITPEHENILVEVTGTDEEAVKNVLTFITTSLADREGTLYSVNIKYKNRRNTTPSFENESMRLRPSEVNKRLGLELSSEKIAELLRGVRYNAHSRSKVIDVQVPCYRVDVLHKVDVIEDVAIAYGLENMEPEMPRVASVGELSQATETKRLLRELFTSMGCQEIRNMVLTNEQVLLKNVNQKKNKLVRIDNPVSEKYTCCRNALIPGLINTLSKNTHEEYPQKIFEVGPIVHSENNDLGSTTKTSAAMCIASADADFTEIKQHLDWFMQARGQEYRLRSTSNPAFVKGRRAKIVVDGETVGIMGEVSPEVLDKNQVSMPVTGFEIKKNE